MIPRANFYLLMSLTLFSFVACNDSEEGCLRPTENLVTEEIDLGVSITGVVMDVSIGNLILTPAPEQRVTVTTSEDLLPLVRRNLFVDEGSWVISLDLLGVDCISIGDGVEFSVTVEAPMINKVNVQNGQVTTSAPFDIEWAEVTLNASRSLHYACHANELRAEVLLDSRLSELQLEGSARSLIANLSGAGVLDAAGLQSTNALASVLGEGSIRVNVRDSLDAFIQGSGEISYAGDPVVTQVIDGTGRVTQE